MSWIKVQPKILGFEVQDSGSMQNFNADFMFEVLKAGI